MMLFSSVVIPSDNEVNLSVAVESVKRAHPNLKSAHIIVVTGQINPSTVRSELVGLTYIVDPKEFLFSRRVNMGIEAAGDRDIVIMGDDVEVVTMDAFDILARESPFRIVAASVRGRVGPSWQNERQSHPVVPFVSFTCVYIPRIVYQMVGPLEEGFPGYGYEDTDYCLRARRAGLSSGVCGSVVVEHTMKLKSAFLEKYKDAMGAVEAEARAAFIEKWKRRLI